VVPVSVRARMDAFEQFARAGLEWQGLSADDTDIEIMRYIDQARSFPLLAEA